MCYKKCSQCSTIRVLQIVLQIRRKGIAQATDRTRADRIGLGDSRTDSPPIYASAPLPAGAA